MSAKARVVTLFDVDNTLLDNDHVIADLSRHLDENFGQESRRRYFEIFEQLRRELGYADYLGALQRYRVENARDPKLLNMSSYLVDYPFANRLFPQALDVVNRAKTWGPAVVLSDGDVVFQPRKIWRSGIQETFEGKVLVYVHKEQMSGDVESRYPAEHYILVDDKLRLLDAFKRIWGRRLTTVFPRQGHYAMDPGDYPPADVTVQRIGDLLDYDLDSLVGAAG